MLCLKILVPNNFAMANPYLHPTAIILKSFQTNMASGYPLESYRLIANHDGNAKIIPFQIDEVAAYEDFVLPDGPKPNHTLSNGIFDRLDELSFMAEDAGMDEPPKKWSFEKPELLYKIAAKKDGKSYGAVFLAVYKTPSKRPKYSNKKYVEFNLKESTILTSRYRYQFDPNNYLVVKGIDLVKDGKPELKIVDSSSFYLNLDLKYFLTLSIGHSDITSRLEAYKVGPIRSIVRVSFAYSFLKLNFEMGMYTEVSFFSNSVILPAIMYNPLDGSKSFNSGTGFYYGFATTFDIGSIGLETNLNKYAKKNILDLFKGTPKVLTNYSLLASHPDFIMLMNISPSWKMKNSGNLPLYYKEIGDPAKISSRKWDTPLPLGEAPVNLGVYFDLNKFAEGEHRVGFNLYFENKNNKELIKSYSNLDKWYYTVSNETNY